MIATLQRTYSKAKANAGHVVWTSQESIPVNFQIDGLISSGDYGYFKVAGRPMYCTGFQVEFTLPGQDPGMLLQISLVNVNTTSPNGATVPGSTSRIYGLASGATHYIAPPFLVFPGTALQFNIAILNGTDNYLPQDASLTYYLNYANGLLNQQGFYAGSAVGQLPAAETLFSGLYNGAAPPIVPQVPYAFGMDLSTGRQWQWYNGVWH